MVTFSNALCVLTSIYPVTYYYMYQLFQHYLDTLRGINHLITYFHFTVEKTGRPDQDMVHLGSWI